MALQERGKVEVVLSPAAERARIIDLDDKAKCWKGHIEIAQKNGDLRQARIGEYRLGAVRRRMGKPRTHDLTVGALGTSLRVSSSDPRSDERGVVVRGKDPNIV